MPLAWCGRYEMQVTLYHAFIPWHVWTFKRHPILTGVATCVMSRLQHQHQHYMPHMSYASHSAGMWDSLPHTRIPFDVCLRMPPSLAVNYDSDPAYVCLVLSCHRLLVCTCAGIPVGEAARYVRVETVEHPGWVAWSQIKVFGGSPE